MSREAALLAALALGRLSGLPRIARPCMPAASDGIGAGGDAGSCAGPVWCRPRAWRASPVVGNEQYYVGRTLKAGSVSCERRDEPGPYAGHDQDADDHKNYPRDPADPVICTPGPSERGHEAVNAKAEKKERGAEAEGVCDWFG
jgi:hypothetical protein